MLQRVYGIATASIWSYKEVIQRISPLHPQQRLQQRLQRLSYYNALFTWLPPKKL